MRKAFAIWMLLGLPVLADSVAATRSWVSNRVAEARAEWRGDVAAATNPVPSWISAAEGRADGRLGSATNAVKGWIEASTNGLPELVAAATNGLPAKIAAVTNGLPAKIAAVTNGLPAKIAAVTNGLPERIATVTNGLPEAIAGTTNGLPERIAAVTNGLPESVVAATNGVMEEVNAATGSLWRAIGNIEGVTADIGELARTNDLPTKVSQLENDAGYLTNQVDVSNLARAAGLFPDWASRGTWSEGEFCTWKGVVYRFTGAGDPSAQPDLSPVSWTVSDVGAMVSRSMAATGTLYGALVELVAGSTNGLPDRIAAVTNGLPAKIAAVTNGLPGRIAAVTNGLPEALRLDIAASTNGLPEAIAAATNGLPELAAASTNGLPEAIAGATNGLPARIAAVTNGLPARMAALTNGLPESIAAATNPVPGWIVASTSGIPTQISSAIRDQVSGLDSRAATRLVSPDGYRWVDGTGAVWQVVSHALWSGNVAESAVGATNWVGGGCGSADAGGSGWRLGWAADYAGSTTGSWVLDHQLSPRGPLVAHFSAEGLPYREGTDFTLTLQSCTVGGSAAYVGQQTDNGWYQIADSAGSLHFVSPLTNVVTVVRATNYVDRLARMEDVAGAVLAVTGEGLTNAVCGIVTNEVTGWSFEGLPAGAVIFDWGWESVDWHLGFLFDGRGFNGWATGSDGYSESSTTVELDCLDENNAGLQYHVTASLKPRNALGLARLSDIPTNNLQLANGAGYAVSDDVVLSPVYSQTPAYGDDWTYEGLYEGYTVIKNPEFHEANGPHPAHWEMEIFDGTQDYGLYDYDSGAGASTLHFGADGNIIATRVRTDIIGYTLGSQTNSVLASTNALSRSSGGITTNDVCNIVTNVVEGWTYEGLPDGAYGISPPFVDGASGMTMGFYYNGVWCSGSNLGATEADTRIVFALIASDTSQSPYYEFSNVIAVRENRNALGLARLSDLPPLTNGLIGADFISTNNAAFVSAVTNCPVAIAADDAEALAEWGIYGGGGTIGALLAALAAAVAALKKKKMPLYPVGGSGNPVNATYESGVLTVSPFAMAAYTPTAGAAFSVAMGSLPSDFESGKARDAVLVIDCSLLSEGDEPTVTWGVNFHPRTDAGTDFACVAGAKNVYYISEYASGEFAVGGWTETAGGNA